MRCGLYNFSENNYLLPHDLQGIIANYTYDAHGNMTSMPHLQELKWDYEDNLKEVVLDASNNTAYYVYDAEGNRVRKVIVKNTGTMFFSSNKNNIANEIEDNGTLIFGGCHIGKGEVGKEFMSRIYEITGKRINIVANTAASVSTRHHTPKETRTKVNKKGNKVTSISKYTVELGQFDLLLDKGLTSNKEQNNGFGWRKIGPKTEGVISTKKDLYLNTKGDAYSFKPFQKFSIPAYYK